MSRSPSEEAGNPEPASKLPWRKNPWFWGVLACIVFPPCIRPFTRDIVEAPLPTSAAVAVQLEGRDGAPFTNRELSERIHITFFVDGDDPGCPPLVETMRPLVERMDIQAYAGRGLLARNAGFGEDIRVLVVAGFSDVSGGVDLSGLERECSLDTDRWVVAGGSAEDVEAFSSALEGREDGASTLASHRRAAIVDTQRRARGLYGTDELGRDELYHRARHVLRDQRMATREASGAKN